MTVTPPNGALRGSAGAIRDQAFSPDGTTLFVVKASGVTIYDTASDAVVDTTT